MEKVRHIFQKHFLNKVWNIALPKDGQHRASYIAQCEQQQLFIKFDVPSDAIQRLGEIEIAPRVLASGICEGKSYVVQAYITGKYPNWRWFANQLPYLATFIKAKAVVKHGSLSWQIIINPNRSKHMGAESMRAQADRLHGEADRLRKQAAEEQKVADNTRKKAAEKLKK